MFDFYEKNALAFIKHDLQTAESAQEIIDYVLEMLTPEQAKQAIEKLQKES